MKRYRIYFVPANLCAYRTVFAYAAVVLRGNGSKGRCFASKIVDFVSFHCISYKILKKGIDSYAA